MEPTRKEMALAVLIMLALPVCAEVVLRIARFNFEPQLYKPDHELGWRLRSGAQGVVSTENQQFVRINSHGFRDVERSYSKPVGTFRIAVLGNSWTEALQVPLKKTYTAELERILNQRGCFASEHVEVLNFGVAGYSTAQELLLLHNEVWNYHPDAVLLAFYPARDIANNLRELNNAVNPEQSPYYLYRDGRLVLDDSFRALPSMQRRQILLQDLRYTMNQHSRLFQVIGALQQTGRIRLAMADAKERATQAGMDNLEYAIYAPPVDAQMQSAWQVTEGLFLLLRDEAKAHVVDFRIVLLATRPQVLPDDSKKLELTRKLGVPNLTYADDRIQQFGKREQIPVIDLAPALAKFAEAHHIFLNGFNASNMGSGHWNETGHRVAAEAIADALCEPPGGTGTRNETAAH